MNLYHNFLFKKYTPILKPDLIEEYLSIYIAGMGLSSIMSGLLYTFAFKQKFSLSLIFVWSLYIIY
jgi:hypothetical protein